MKEKKRLIILKTLQNIKRKKIIQLKKLAQ